MHLTGVILAGASIYLLARFALIPLADRPGLRLNLAAEPKRRACAAAAGALAGLAFWFTLSAILAALLVWYLTGIEAATLGEAQAALERVRRADELFGRLGSGFGLLLSAAACLGILVWSYRHVRRETAMAIDARISAAMGETHERALRGELEPLDPSPAMLEVDALIDQSRERLAVAEADPEAAAALSDIDRLSAIRHHLDLFRRVEPAVAAGLRRGGDSGRRWTTFFVSNGFYDTLSFGGKVVSIACVLAMIPASLVITGPLAQDRLEERKLALEADARQFEFVAARGEINQAYMDLTARAETAAEEAELAPEDIELAQALAHAFEANAFPRQLATDAARELGRDSVRALQRVRTRAAILTHAAARMPGLAVAVADAPLAPAASEAELLLARSLDADGPVTAVGREAARENLAIARSNPELWADLKQKFHAYRASFGVAAPPQRVYALALNQAIGQATGAIDVGEGFFAQQARAFGSSVSSDAAGAYVEASYRSFIVDFTRTGDLNGSASRAAERAVLAITPDDVVALRQMVDVVPEPASWNSHLEGRRAALQAVSLRGDAAATERAAQRVASQVSGNSLSAVDALAEFGDYFPGNAGEDLETRRARTARALKLDGAPPAAAQASRAVLTRSRAAATRAGSFVRLRGFARVGGVLIGREPERSQELHLDHFDWTLDGGQFRFRIAANGGEVHAFGPFSAAITNLALAYAADGRPTTVTMVSASPLRELRILVHPALIDTGLGCRAIRLDQFADEATGGSEPLARIRDEETTMAIGEVALYNFARNIRVATLAGTPEGAELVASWEVTPLVEQARAMAEDPGHANAATLRLAAGRELPMTIARKPAYFAAPLVSSIEGCLGSADLGAFASCVADETTRQAGELLGNADWLAHPVAFETWSGVREKPYSVDATFAFLREDLASRLGPLTFMTQLAIDSPAYFADPARPWFDEENTAPDDYVDPEPWEFPATGAALDPAVAALLDADADSRTVFDDMAEFALLQRFFRAALDGSLSGDFPLESLQAIQHATDPSVHREAPTLRWNVRPGELEGILANVLADIAEPDGAVQDCLRLAASDEVSKLGQPEWEATCGPEFLARSLTQEDAGLAGQIAAARALRIALGVPRDEVLAEDFIRGCPAP